MQWITDHSQLISALTSVGTLLVWVIYLQVFVHSYRRQLRATLLITRGPGDGLASSCFLTNMSSGPVYVLSVFVTLETSDGTVVRSATNIQDADSEGLSRPLERTRQGPLQPGGIRDIGSFQRLMGHALQEADSRSERIQAITVVVLGTYGSEDLPVGARRRFLLTRTEDRLELHACKVDTEQVRKRSERRKLLEDLQRDQ
ncbi:hypothetical protein [Cupriavidus sp. AU9028]|uniref:hypothetical protein n=1 Tax=Cupriavidus sp. AU9028 TaxID=2871157 RepID=UPI001C98222C|nr:hypothetical protein [Cupriavidus sp. AU9028]MBY4898269.1 hypothetical protein [Cupriavidus sp. AU9028]